MNERAMLFASICRAAALTVFGYPLYWFLASIGLWGPAAWFVVLMAVNWILDFEIEMQRIEREANTEARER